jgi:hypothetical protein
MTGLALRYAQLRFALAQLKKQLQKFDTPYCVFFRKVVQCLRFLGALCKNSIRILKL